MASAGRSNVCPRSTPNSRRLFELLALPLRRLGAVRRQRQYLCIQRTKYGSYVRVYRCLGVTDGTPAQTTPARGVIGPGGLLCGLGRNTTQHVQLPQFTMLHEFDLRALH